MTNLVRGFMLLVAGASVTSAQITQGLTGLQRGSAEQIAQLSSRPTPRLPDGTPDLNGTWDHLGAIEWVQPQVAPDGSVLCITGCGRPEDASADAETSPASHVRTFPRYRPEFEAKVRGLRENQVRLDTTLRCAPPGVPRLGPPREDRADRSGGGLLL